MDLLYDRIHKEVAREARLAAGRWNGFISADDIEQELWLWIMERPGTQRFFRTANPAQLSAALSSRAGDICSKEKVSYEHFSGQYVYTPADIRGLLETYFGTDVSKVSSEVMALAESELSETMIQNILGGYITPEEKIDLEEGMEDLEDRNNDYFQSILSQFQDGKSINNNTSEQRVQYRAVDKLCDLMNRKHSQRVYDRTEGPGTKPKNTQTKDEDY